MEKPDSKVYTVPEIAAMLSVSKSEAYKFVNSNPPFDVLKVGTAVRIPKEKFDKWFEGELDK